MPPAKKPDADGNWECNYCKKWKPAKEFNIDRKKKNGLRTYCRRCEVAWHRGYVERKKQQEIRQRAVAEAIVEFLVANPIDRDQFVRKHKHQLEPLIHKHTERLTAIFLRKRAGNRKGAKTKRETSARIGLRKAS